MIPEFRFTLLNYLQLNETNQSNLIRYDTNVFFKWEVIAIFINSVVNHCNLIHYIINVLGV